MTDELQIWELSELSVVVSLTPWGYWVYLVISVMLIGKDFDLDTFKHALSTGTGRIKCYAVKVLTTYILTAVLFALAMALICFINCLKYGFNPQDIHIENLFVKLAVIYGLACVLALTYVSIFDLMCFICRSSGIPFILGAVFVLADAVITLSADAHYGYLPKTLHSINMVLAKTSPTFDVLKPEILSMFVPCICIILVCNVVSIVLFMHTGLSGRLNMVKAK